MVTCKEIYKMFKQIDIFGVNLAFSYNSKAAHKSLVGSLLTIILFSLLIYKLIFEIKNLILVEDFDITVTNSPAIDDSIELKDIEIAVCPVFNIVFHRNMDHIFKFSYGYVNGRGEILQSDILSKDNCSRKVKIGDGHTYNTKDFCHCVKFDEPKYFNITKDSSLFADNFLSIKIEANFQLAEESIKKDEGPFRLLRSFLFLYQNNYINASDYFHLIRNYDAGMSDLMNIGTETYINFGIDKIQVDDVNDIFSFGLFEPDITSNYSYNIYRKDSSIIDVNEGEGYSAIYYLIKHNGLLTTYSISTFNLEKLLALFGGYFQVFFVVFSLISTFTNNISLERKIENNFKKNTKFIEKLLKELDEALLQSRKEIINFNLVKSENDVQSDEEKIAIHKRIPSVNINERFPPEKQEYNPNNFNNSPSLNVTENKLNNLRRVTMFRKQGRVISNEEYYKEIKDDFIAQIDYVKFYKLIKEIKLIKFFLLDLESSQWIFKLEQYPFNINKFEQFIQENYNSQVELQTDENLSHIQKKLKLMKEFLVTFNINKNVEVK